MPRAERDVNASLAAVAAFAQGLRELRLQAGKPSYRALAARTHFAPSTLSTAASGDRLPSLQVTLAYVKACRGDEAIWHRRWVATSRSIINQVDADRSAATAENQGRRTRPAHLNEVSRVQQDVFKVAVSVTILGVLIRAWSAFRNARSTSGPQRR